MCKAGITNIVLENYKRDFEELPLIPVIFCIDSETLPFDSKRIASKDKELNCLFTHQEIRRACKLCCEVENECLKEIALKTFKFTKLVKVKDETYKLELIKPFWQTNSDWQDDWKERRNISSTKKESATWKKELIKAIVDYDLIQR